MNKRLPNISIEKYAAYLDGNLPEEEMQQMETFIENDEDMRAFLEADDIVDSNYTLPEQEPIPFDIGTDSIELPVLENDIVFDDNGFIDELFSDEGGRNDEDNMSIPPEMSRLDIINVENRTDEVGGEQIPCDFGIEPTEQSIFDDDLLFGQDGLIDLF